MVVRFRLDTHPGHCDPAVCCNHALNSPDIGDAPATLCFCCSWEISHLLTPLSELLQPVVDS